MDGKREPTQTTLSIQTVLGVFNHSKFNSVKTMSDLPSSAPGSAPRRNNKRARSPPRGSQASAGPSMRSSPPPSSLPPSSPPPPFDSFAEDEEIGDEEEEAREVGRRLQIDVDDDNDEGENLFGDNMMK